MRCYFMRDGQIVDVEPIVALSDEEAINKARKLFDSRDDPLDGFDVWHRGRMVFRHLISEASKSSSS
jgi:hypothetical protein